MGGILSGRNTGDGGCADHSIGRCARMGEGGCLPLSRRCSVSFDAKSPAVPASRSRTGVGPGSTSHRVRVRVRSCLFESPPHSRALELLPLPLPLPLPHSRKGIPQSPSRAASASASTIVTAPALSGSIPSDRHFIDEKEHTASATLKRG